MSGARPFRDARASRSPLRLALRIGAVPPTRSPPLLWPLLTARAAPSPRRLRLAFTSEASSPQVRLLGYPCTSAGSTERLLGRESFAVICPLALSRPALHPVSIRRPTGLASRCFQRFSRDPRLAVRSGRCDQLPRGLSPPSRLSCWAHKGKGPVFRRSPVQCSSCSLSQPWFTGW